MQKNRKKKKSKITTKVKKTDLIKKANGGHHSHYGPNWDIG